MAVQMTEAEALALYNYSLQGGETTVPEPEPEVEVEAADYGKDWLKSFPRAGKALVDLPQNLAGLAATGLKAGEDWNAKRYGREGFFGLPEDHPTNPKTSDDIANASLVPYLSKVFEDAPRAGNLVPESLTERSVPKGHSRLFDATLLGTELAAFGIPSVARQLVTGGAPLKAAKAATLMGAGGSAGAEGGKEIDKLMKNEGPYAEIVGMLLGAGGVPALLTGKTASTKAAGIIEDSTALPSKLQTPSLTRGGMPRDPLQDVRGVKALADSLRNKPKPELPSTLGDVIATGDDATGSLVLGLENQLAAVDPKLKGGIAGIQRLRERVVGEKVKSAISDNPALPKASQKAASEQLARGTEGIKTTAADARTAADAAIGNKVVRQEQVQAASSNRLARTDAEVLAAQEAATKAATEATRVEGAVTGSALPRSTQSAKLFEAVEAAHKAVKKKVKKLYKKYDKGDTIARSEVEAEAVGFLNPTPAQKMEPAVADMVQYAAKFAGQIKRLNPDIPPAHLSYVLAKMKKAISNDYKNSNATLATSKLSEEIKGLEKFLAKNNKHYKKATSAEKGRHEVFDPLESTAQTSKTYVKPPQFKGQSGAEITEQLAKVNDPKVLDELRGWVLSMAKAEKITPKFRQNYGGVLNHPKMSGLNDEITLIEAAQTTAATAATTAKGLVQARKAVKSADTAKQKTSKAEVSRLTKARKAEETRITSQQKAAQSKLDESIVSEYSTSADDVVDRLLQKTDDINRRSFEKLNDTLTKAGQGDSFRSQVRDRVMGLIGRKTGGQTDVSVMSMSKWDELRPQLIESKVLSSQEAKQVTRALEGLDTQTLRASVAQGQDSVVSRAVDDILASVKATLTAKALPNTGNSLMVMSSLKRAFKAQQQAKALSPEVMGELRHVFLNPETLAKMAQKYKTEADMTAAFTALMSESAAKLEENEEKE